MTKTVKDITSNDKLAPYILEAVDESTPVNFEVWAIGFNTRYKITDATLLLKEFNDPADAIEYAMSLTLADVVHIASEAENTDPVDDNLLYITIEVQATVKDEFGTRNIGTICETNIWLGVDE